MSYLDEKIADALGLPMGTEVTIKFKVTGIVDSGREIQLQLPDGLFTYLPVRSVLEADLA